MILIRVESGLCSDKKKGFKMIIIKRGVTDWNTKSYGFYGEDEDGELRNLGGATERVQDEGTDEELHYFEGYFDTRAISFANEAELDRIIRRREGIHTTIHFE